VDIGYALTKGFIQGLTEFLPVSSTAHLIFTDHLLGGLWAQSIHPNEAEFYDILLHMGTLGAVIVYFRQDLSQVLQAVVGKSSSASQGGISGDAASRCPFPSLARWSQNIPNWVWLLAVSMVLTVGFILLLLKGSEVVMAQMGWLGPNVGDISEFFLAHPQLVALHLMGTGCLMFLVDRQSAKPVPAYQQHHKPGDLSRMTLRQAVVVGLAQGWAAIFHGFSRSGTTISGGLLSGLDRYTATRYTFLLSIPTFLMAMVYESLKILKLDLSGHLDWTPMLAGTVVSGLVGYGCVKYFLRFVANHSLLPFSIYCWIVSTLMLWHFSQ
jgi:undecaprenyl-diphosphatase